MFSFGFQSSLPDMNQSQRKAWSEGVPEPAATPRSGIFPFPVDFMAAVKASGDISM